MLIEDIMTKDVITMPGNTLVSDALKVMKEHNFRRLPVVDSGKLAGIVTQERLERVAPKTSAPLMWQIQYIVAHTRLRDVMRRDVVTLSPDATVEQGVALAQQKKVGSLLVTDKGKVVGVVTTNDFFYAIINQMMGIGEPGTRIMVMGAGDGRSAEKVLSIVNKLNVATRVIWTARTYTSEMKDLILHLDTPDAAPVIAELRSSGFEVAVRPHRLPPAKKTAGAGKK
ncbi:MAG: CBS domain-containing protein [Chloroflexi bacterium]|nr:CBS domain-containing protein [Chloroflexota bacterium]